MVHHDSPRSRAPRTARLERDVAMRLAATEYERVVETLAGLTADQWAAPTDCPGWDVRAMAGHVLGMTQMAASLPEMAASSSPSQRRGRRDERAHHRRADRAPGGEERDLSTDEVVEAMRRTGPRAARGRRRTPGFVRRRTVPEEQVFGDQREWWTSATSST